MKTALQELLEWMNAQMFIKPKDLYSKVKELLPKEKEQLKDSWQEGSAFLGDSFDEFEDYYNKTYGEENN